VRSPSADCDALEDLLAMSTTQVQQFCDACSSDDECTVPEMYTHNGYPKYMGVKTA
jgi:hypothetical protein